MTVSVVGTYTLADRLTLAFRYQAFSTFGAISYCNSPDFNGVDGILGFGLPVAALARAPVDPNDPVGGQRRSGSPPPPLFTFPPIGGWCCVKTNA